MRKNLIITQTNPSAHARECKQNCGGKEYNKDGEQNERWPGEFPMYFSYN